MTAFSSPRPKQLTLAVLSSTKFSRQQTRRTQCGEEAVRAINSSAGLQNKAIGMQDSKQIQWLCNGCAGMARYICMSGCVYTYIYTYVKEHREAKRSAVTVRTTTRMQHPLQYGDCANSNPRAVKNVIR
ncbi:hypothetical protein ACFX12_032397 [Malus domestica]